MNAIEFRGKDSDDGSWCYGDVVIEAKPLAQLINDLAKSTMVELPAILNMFGIWSVKRETIGQYTNKHDISEKKIYVGDICEVKMGGELQITPYTVLSIETLHFDMNNPDSYLCINSIRVIGNIHDNPELLGMKRK